MRRAVVALLFVTAAFPAKAACINIRADLQGALEELACVQQEQSTRIVELQTVVLQMQSMLLDLDRASIDPDKVADIQFRLRKLQEAVDKLTPAPVTPAEPERFFWQ